MAQFNEIMTQLMTHSDASRSNSFKALKSAVSGEFDKAEESLTLAKQDLLKAHTMQTNLIENKPKKETTEINLLLTHVQDHLITSIMAKDLIGVIVKNQKEIVDLKRIVASR